MCNMCAVDVYHVCIMIDIHDVCLPTDCITQWIQTPKLTT